MFHLIPFIKAIGYLGIFGIIFCETGILVGFFLPGDTLLFSVGVLTYQNYLNFTIAIIVLILAAICGATFGYLVGKKTGPYIFNKENSIFFKRSYVERAHRFFDKYGNVTVFITRYIPILRTFSPTIAGVAKMKFRNFMFYNILGAIAWCLTIVSLGYFLGEKVSNIDRYLLPLIAIACISSFVPIIYKVFKTKKKTF